jgi:membrane-bound serine protease (ClpP class)
MDGKASVYSSAARLTCIFVLLLVLFSFIEIGYTVNGDGSVYIIPIRGEITPAMASFVVRNIELANTARSKGILIEISTLGGRADAAMGIKTAILDSKVPVTVFIEDRAVSAGALISIAANTIIMTPGSHMGAAEPIPNTPKAVAAIAAEFKGAAEARGRDPQIAAAMVDRNIAIPVLTEAGSILSLTAQEAYDRGYANALLYGRNEVLKHLGWEDAHINEVHPDVRIRIAQFLTRHEIASILLTIGMLALIMEIFAPGFGLPGIVGLVSFALYFGGGFLAGHTEWWPLMLFALGIGLLIAEAAMPGFGILGVSGVIVVFISLILAAPDPVRGITSVGIAFIVSALAIPILGKIFGWAKLLNRFVMTEVLTADAGNVPINSSVKIPEIGQIGVAITQLRPAGIAEFGGTRHDCMSDGDFITAGTEVKVVQATASKIVVIRYNK